MESFRDTQEDIRLAPVAGAALVLGALVVAAAYYVAVELAPRTPYVRSAVQADEQEWPRVQSRFRLSDRSIETLKRLIVKSRAIAGKIGPSHVERAFVLMAGRTPSEVDTLRKDLRLRVLRESRRVFDDVMVLNIVELVTGSSSQEPEAELRIALSERPKFIGKLDDVLGKPY